MREKYQRAMEIFYALKMDMFKDEMTQRIKENGRKRTKKNH